MYLIAESGSTKTQWCAVNETSIKNLINTPGINPFNLSTTEIESIIRPVSVRIEQQEIKAIYYFGAGCSTPNNINKIGSALFKIFNCSNIFIDTDLKAACLALAGNSPGMIGLLGTGSNSCIWDGKEITHNIPSLGYILGDEGGGVSIGKQLVTDYLKKYMPEEIRSKFASKHNITREYVLERVYQNPMPNKFLAGFAPFAESYINNEYCYNLIYNQFELFIEKNILLYPNYKEYNISFCGSIAYSHQDIMKQLCGKYDLNINKIVKEPINNLSSYVQKMLFSEKK
jgi:N-acetylglucosamine kinase-like BadF-type ATPase